MVEGRDLERGSGHPGGGDGHLGEDLVDLVLGTGDTEQRAEMVAHVLRCAACRHDYDELAATVESLLPAVPAAQPPLGFDERALGAMGRAQRGQRAPGRRWAAAAAAALLALLVPVGVWLATRGGDAGTGEAGAVATLRRTDGDAPVGTVSIAEVGDERVMVVALVGAPSDVGYFCRAHLSDGTVTESPSWPAGNGAWVVPLPGAGDVTSVEVLPTGADHVWSSATFS